MGRVSTCSIPRIPDGAMNATVATYPPSAEWIARQLSEACGWEQPPKFLIRDRDGAFGDVFKRRLRAMGSLLLRAPWQKGHCERLIGSIRRECLDHS